MPLPFALFVLRVHFSEVLKLFESSRLKDAALSQHKYFVCVSDGADAVGDANDRNSVRQLLSDLLQSGLDFLLRRWVECRGRLVQDE